MAETQQGGLGDILIVKTKQGAFQWAACNDFFSLKKSPLSPKKVGTRIL